MTLEDLKLQIDEENVNRLSVSENKDHDSSDFTVTYYSNDNRRRSKIEPEDDLYTYFSERFEEIRNRVSSDNICVKSITIREYKHNINQEVNENESIETAFLLVNTKEDITEEDEKTIDKILSTVNDEFDIQVGKDDINDSVIHFSDFEYLSVSTVNTGIKTNEPYKFYRNVDSMSEFYEKSRDDDMNTYDSYVPMHILRDDIPESLQTHLIDIMESFIDSVEIDTSDLIKEVSYIEGETYNIFYNDFRALENVKFISTTDIEMFDINQGQVYKSFWMELELDNNF